jgi:hypothetical protein
MTSDDTTALTTAEAESLETLEQRISDGLETFIAVGDALRTIRDDRLYRMEFPTFDAYTAGRWGMTYRRAVQLMDAAEVVEEIKDAQEQPAENVNHGSQTQPILTPQALPQSERQARPLTELDTPAEKAEAWQAAVAAAPKTAGKPKVTAKAVKQAVEKVKAKRREPEAVAETPAEPAAPAAPQDDNPAEPWAPFNADVLKLISALRSIGRQINQLFEIKDGVIGNRWASRYSVNATTSMVNTVIRNLENGMPAQAAPDEPCGFLSAGIVRDRQRFAKSA